MYQNKGGATNNQGGQNAPHRKNTAGRKNQNNHRGGGGQVASNNTHNADQRGPKGGAGKGKKAAQQQQQQQSYDMKQVDEAIISTSNTTISMQSQPADNENKGERRERALQKTSWLPKNESGKLETLDELGGSVSGEFNQFAGKKTDYTDDHYSTPLNMAAISKEKQQYAMKVEREITSAVAKNRHVAEDRNQVELHSDNEGDEEVKYGATDRKLQKGARNQDGGVFDKSQNNTKQRKKNSAVNAPKGKFTNFHKQIDGKVWDTMSEGFIKDLIERNPTDSFFKPSSKNSTTTTPVAPTTNLQSQQISSSIYQQPTANPQNQQKMVVTSQAFIPQTSQQPQPKPVFFNVPPQMPPPPQKPQMPAQTNTYGASAAAPLQQPVQNSGGINQAPPQNAQTNVQSSATPLTVLSTNVQEFMPSSIKQNQQQQPFMPNPPPQQAAFQPQQSMPFKNPSSATPFIPNVSAGSQIYPPSSMPASQYGPQASSQPFAQQQFQSFPPQQQQQFQPYMPTGGGGVPMNTGTMHAAPMPVMQPGGSFHPNQMHHQGNMMPQYRQHYNQQQPQHQQYGGGRTNHHQHHYGQQQAPPLYQQKQQQQAFARMPMPQQKTQQAAPGQNDISRANDTPAGQNPFASLALQKNNTFEPSKKQ